MGRVITTSYFNTPGKILRSWHWRSSASSSRRYRSRATISSWTRSLRKPRSMKGADGPRRVGGGFAQPTISLRHLQFHLLEVRSLAVAAFVQVFHEHVNVRGDL